MMEIVCELERIACAAGRLISVIRTERIDVTAKSDGSPVTIADARAENLILEQLSHAFPGIAVVAEERAGSAGIPDVGGGRFFLVDPLDGTKEFIKGTSDFTVNIALIEGGAPVAGVVMAPGRGEIYSGYAGGGARFSRVADAGPPIDGRSIHVRTPGTQWTALMSLSHMTAATRDFLEPLPIAARICLGSSLKFCMLAAGVADIYPRFGRTMQWDTAAGDAILRAAGGITLSRDGDVLRYGPRPGIGKDDFGNPEFVAFAGTAQELRRLLAD